MQELNSFQMHMFNEITNLISNAYVHGLIN
jgi:hypothetical protein